MIELIIGSLVVVIIGIGGYLLWRLHDVEMTNFGYLKTIRYQQAQLDNFSSIIARVNQDIDLIRSDARVEARTYMDRAVVYERTISSKNQQISNMAERVASLKLVPGVEGGEDMHVEDVPPDEPYSPELQEWVDGLRDSESRASARDFVEIRRRNHNSDEQILEDLEESWTV